MGWLIPLVLYAPLALWGASLHREAINPDAIAYIRRAMYLSELKLWAGISGYWSPLISWCTAPLIRLGFDGLYSARAVLAIWGLIYVGTVCWFIWRFMDFTPPLRVAVGCVVALFAAHAVTQTITPDLILAACLFGYFALVTRADLLRSWRVQALVGAAGAVAYLAKAYGLPFFLVHFVATVGLRAWLESAAPGAPEDRANAEARWPLRASIQALAVALLALVVVAGPWVGLLSAKYGTFTVALAGRINHAVVGPVQDPPGGGEYFGVPPRPYILRHEITEFSPRAYWSPLQSWSYFRHQLAVMGRHFLAMVRTAGSLDLLWLSVVAVVSLPLLGRRILARDERSFRIIWIFLTACLYCSGFLFVHFERRFIEPILLPLGMLLALEVWRMLGQRSAPAVRGTGQAIILLSFGAMMLWHLAHDLSGRRHYPHRVVAQEMLQRGIRGPIASTQKRNGMYLCYHLNLPFAGFPQGSSVEEVEDKLRAINATLVLWRPHRSAADEVQMEYSRSDQLANELVRRPNWRRLMTRKVSARGAVEVWVHRWPPEHREHRQRVLRREARERRGSQQETPSPP